MWVCCVGAAVPACDKSSAKAPTWTTEASREAPYELTFPTRKWQPVTAADNQQGFQHHPKDRTLLVLVERLPVDMMRQRLEAAKVVQPFSQIRANTLASDDGESFLFVTGVQPSKEGKKTVFVAASYYTNERRRLLVTTVFEGLLQSQGIKKREAKRRLFGHLAQDIAKSFRWNFTPGRGKAKKNAQRRKKSTKSSSTRKR